MSGYWPRTLFGRNVLLLAMTTALSVALSFLSIYILILNAQIDRFTSIAAELINTTSNVARDLDPVALDNLLSQLDGSEYLQIMPLGVTPEIGNYEENNIEKMYMQRIIDRLDAQDEMEWRIGENRTLWLNLRIGNDYYWIAAESGTTWTPIRWLILIMCLIILIVTMIGVLVTRQISKPLAVLRSETDKLSLGSSWQLSKEINGPAEIKELANSFERMAARIEEAESIRAETLAEISHDIRTPLARLRLAVEMMKDGDELKASAVRQVQQIDRLLDQFMDYARDGRSEPMAAFDLSHLLKTLADEFQIDRDIETDIELFGQKELIRRAICNLIENAQKYGAPPVRLSLHLSQSHAVIEVKDMGAGFDPGETRDLISAFKRGAHDAHVAGSGLGLTIVHRVAMAYNGDITFQRIEPTGFIARLTLDHNKKP